MTLLFLLPDNILKMYALSIWSRNEHPADIIGTLQDIDKVAVIIFTFMFSMCHPKVFESAHIDFKGTNRFAHFKR